MLLLLLVLSVNLRTLLLGTGAQKWEGHPAPLVRPHHQLRSAHFPSVSSTATLVVFIAVYDFS